MDIMDRVFVEELRAGDILFIDGFYTEVTYVSEDNDEIIVSVDTGLEIPFEYGTMVNIYCESMFAESID